MSASQLPNDPAALREELQDRLADLALCEILGSRKPPEVVLSARRPSAKWRTFTMLALAASLLLAATIGGFAWWKSRQELDQVALQQRANLGASDHRSMTHVAKELDGLSNTAFVGEAAVPDALALEVAERDLNDVLPLMGTKYAASGPAAHKPSALSSQAQPRKKGDPGKFAIISGESQSGKADDYVVTDGRTQMLVTPRIIIQEEESLLGDFRNAKSEGEIRERLEQYHAQRTDQGRGPGEAGDRYSRIIENPFLKATENPLSTFSIDADTASYAKSRRYLLENRMLPPPDAVRIEEFVNYFHYDYAPPKDASKPFAAHVEVAACPWAPKHRLVRIGLKGREIAREARPASNLVFLVDVSGSMSPDDRLPRVRRAMKMLTEQLGENDRVAIVVYAGASGLALPSTPAYRKDEILQALDRLQSGGSTNGGAGIRLAYDLALAHFIKGGTNRVILCTDGDFNVGTTSTGELERLAEEKAKTGVFLTVLGFGMGNHNDDMLEKLADKGNGNYGYIDTEEEARKLLVEELSGTLVTIAKDVKIQVEFNPGTVGAYRLLGYENRLLRAEDFNDDKKDAGEIGAGHTVTALYEIVPAGEKIDTPPVDPLRYQQVTQPSDATASGELLTLKLRYKERDGQESKAPLIFPVTDAGRKFGQASPDFKFATAVAGFAMLLRNSQHRGNFTYDAVLEIAQEGRGEDRSGYRGAFIELVKQAKAVGGPEPSSRAP